jgi:hypothetical protein
LVAPSVFLARSEKKDILTREAPFVNLVCRDEYCVDPQVEKACSWVSQLGPACDGSDGFNAEKVIKHFVILLCKTTQAWSKIADFNKQERDTIQNEKDAISLESDLMMVARLIYKIDTYEKRRLPNMEPYFLINAFEDLSPSWRNQFPNIWRKKDVISRPVVWIFAPLLEVMYSQKNHNKAAVLTLLALLELFAIELGDDESNFLTAILFTVRCSVLNWNISEINPDIIISEKEIAELMKLYEEKDP